MNVIPTHAVNQPERSTGPSTNDKVRHMVSLTQNEKRHLETNEVKHRDYRLGEHRIPEKIPILLLIIRRIASANRFDWFTEGSVGKLMQWHFPLNT